MVSARLAYLNDSPEILAWSEDFKARFKTKADALWSFVNGMYDAAGVPEDDKNAPDYKRQRLIYQQSHGYITGIRWPRKLDSELPEHWFRPAKEDHLVRPRGNTPGGKAAGKELQKLQVPSMARELEKSFGMPQHVFAGNGFYSSGISLKDDGVWVTWASRDVEDELAKPAYSLEEHGWRLVPIAEYIARVGEKEALGE